MQENRVNCEASCIHLEVSNSCSITNAHIVHHTVHDVIIESTNLIPQSFFFFLREDYPPELCKHSIK